MGILEKIGTIDVNGIKVELHKTEYLNHRIAIQGLYREGGSVYPYGMLTVNIPDANIEKDEFCIKCWSENEEFYLAALKSGLFVDTKARIKTGHVLSPIWKLAKIKED